MGCCCADDPEADKGYKTERKCRDVLILLVFIIFWAGMFVICGFAFKRGDANRLIYGVDSYGNTCGSSKSVFDEVLDLTDSKKLYYLNPLALTSLDSIRFAKAICVPECPKLVCDFTQGPCDGEHFLCPYYRFANYAIFDSMSGTPWNSTNYYAGFENININASASDASFISKAESLGTPWSTLVSDMGLSGATAGMEISGKYYQLQSQFPSNGPCYAVSVPSAEFINRCYPEISKNLTEQLVQGVGSAAAEALGDNAAGSFVKKMTSGGFVWSQYVSDITRGILIITVAGLGGGLVITLVWMLMMRFFASIFAWASLIFFNVIFTGLAIYCWIQSGYIGNHSIKDQLNSKLPGDLNPASLSTKTWMWISIGASVVAGIVLIFSLLCISRLRVAIACIKVAAQAVAAMPSILFFPILPFIFTCGLVIYWIAVSGLLYTTGTLTAHCRSPLAVPAVSYADFPDMSNLDLTALAANASSTSSATYKCYTDLSESEKSFQCGRDPTCYLNYDWDKEMMYVMIYHFFGLLWTNQVFVGFSCVVTSGAVGSHYWAGGDSAKMPYFPVLRALKNAFVFHLGSIIFGAFFMAIFQFIRYVLEYVDQKSRQLQNASSVARWLMCCLRCFLWCIEKVVSFINRNAYVIIGVKGSNYCSAVCTAIKLIVTNAMRIATVNVVGDLMLLIGKLIVAASCGVIAFGLAELPYYRDPVKYPNTQLTSAVLPVALAVIIGFIVAETFFAVYEMAIDTVMICFCEDCDMHGGTPKYAPELLLEAVGAPPPQPESHVGSRKMVAEAH